MLRLAKSVGLSLRQLVRGNRRFARRVNSTFVPSLEHEQILKSILDLNIKQLADEKDGSEDYLNDFITANSWTVSNPIDSDQIEITKIVNKTLIKIIYMPQNDLDCEDEDLVVDESKEDENRTGFTSLKCMIILDRGYTMKILIDAEVFEEEFLINSVVIGENVESKAKQRFTWNYHYMGPVFESLSEPMQTQLVEYLDSLGINEELASFIEESAASHKSRQLKNLLHKFKEFLE